MISQPLSFNFGVFTYAATSSPSCTVFSVKIPANVLANALTAFSKLPLPVKFVVKI
jgi:hypothetical protein